jgi:hypothetical protein
VGSRGWIALGTLAAFLAVATSAAAQSGEPFRQYGGRLPFHCQIQDVGTGTAYPHPRADPFCVEYDKTNQNVTNFGLVDFLSKEPARVAAATPKCFYFQRDHWTGSVVQGQERKLWHWDGNYFFDKAKGIGGVSVHNFTVGGVRMDVSRFAPDAMKPFFHGGGGGGVMLLLQTIREPACAAKVDTRKERRKIYRRWYKRATG